MNRSFPIVALLLIVASLGCGGKSLPDKPQLIVDRDSIGFGLEFGSGAYIGTMKQDSLQITNGGLQDLVIMSSAYTGDPAFTIDGPLKTTLKGNETTFVRIIFSPTEEKSYMGAINLVTNAETNATTKSTPNKTITISGKGIKFVADGG